MRINQLARTRGVRAIAQVGIGIAAAGVALLTAMPAAHAAPASVTAGHVVALEDPTTPPDPDPTATKPPEPDPTTPPNPEPTATKPPEPDPPKPTQPDVTTPTSPKPSVPAGDDPGTGGGDGPADPNVPPADGGQGGSNGGGTTVGNGSGGSGNGAGNGGGGASLPITGTDAASILGLGALLVGGGAGLVVMSRRRTRPTVD
jgi:LPXTG-motif cell wall-anchored protein